MEEESRSSPYQSGSLCYAADESTLLRDIQKLIFDDEHSVSELLDHFGNGRPISFTTAHKDAPLAQSVEQEDSMYGSLQNLPRSPSVKKVKHVTIQEEPTYFDDFEADLLDLPLGLTLLYYAAMHNTRSVAPTLLHLLEVVATTPTHDNTGHRLYEVGREKLQRVGHFRDDQLKVKLERELAQCTFTPTISATAKAMAPKGLSTFYAKCVEWQKKAVSRLEKKAIQDRQNRGDDDAYKQWTISEASNKFYEKWIMKGNARRSLWVPKAGGVHGLREDNSFTATLRPPPGRSRRGFDDAATTKTGSASGTGGDDSATGLDDTSGGDVAQHLARSGAFFRPVTGELIRERIALLLGAGSEAGTDGVQHHRRNASNASSQTVSFLKRCEEDIHRRRAEAEFRTQHKERAMLEGFFEPTTGQPLYQPNALPTMVVDGERIPWDKLEPDQQHKLRVQLQRQGLEYLVSSADYLEGKEHLRERRSPSKLLADMEEYSRRAAVRSEAARRRMMVEQDATFSPSVDKRSALLASQQPHRLAVHERPLPEGKRVKDTPPRSHLVPTCEEHINSMLARTEDWCALRDRRRQAMQERFLQEDMAECTFEPNRGGNDGTAYSTRPGLGTTASGGSIGSRVVDNDQLVANAEVRMCNELELLKSHAAFQDGAFLKALKARGSSNGVSLSRITFQNAPKPMSLMSSPSQGDRASADPLRSGSGRPIYRGSLGGFGSHNRSDSIHARSLGALSPSSIPVRSNLTSVSPSNGGAHRFAPSYGENGEAAMEKRIDKLYSVLDEWTLLDAQTDEILRNISSV